MGAWVYTYKRVPRIAVIAIAALVLVLWDRPTGKVIIGLTLIVLLVMAIIERATSAPSSCSREEPGRRRRPKRQSPKGQAPFLKSVNPPHNSAEARKLTTQRKPMCVVEVSGDWGDRASGR
jgi:hypothetical protein